MSIILWLIIGGLAGWVASLITGKDDSLGIPGNVIVGILGAFIGGFISSLLGGPDRDLGHPDLGSFLVAVLGAVVLLWAVSAFRSRSRRNRTGL